MSPIGYRHSYVVTRLNKLFVLRAKNRYEVQPQNPVALSDISEPQPDLALVRSEVVSRAEGLPEPEDTFLIVEIADASLRYDRGRKLRAYARAGIAELWIVNLKDNTIEIHREPEGETYRFSRIARGREKVAPAAFPDVAVVVEKLIP